MISNRIGQRRAKLGLTQEEFAKRIGYSRSYLAEIESGKVKPSRNFLEAIKKIFNISIDALMTDSLLVDTIDAHRGTDNPDIIFVYGFVQNEIDEIEKHLKALLADRKLILVDARGVKSISQLLKKILQKEGRTNELHDELKTILLNDEVMLVLKGLSQSKMQKKEIGGIIRDLFKIMDDAWIEDRHNKMEHKNPNSAIIVLDFPSLLEDCYEAIGFYAIPIHPQI